MNAAPSGRSFGNAMFQDSHLVVMLQSYDIPV
jgi:hypothetical protein